MIAVILQFIVKVFLMVIAPDDKIFPHLVLTEFGGPELPVEAKYVDDTLSFLLSADVRQFEDHKVIVSSVTWLRDDSNITLSKLHLPAQHLMDRKIKGIESAIEDSSELMANKVVESGLSIDELVSVYDFIADELFTQLLPRMERLTQLHFSLMYHSSIVHAAKRISSGYDGDLCKAYKAYEYRGIFICSQEYDEHIRQSGVVSKEVQSDGNIMMTIKTEDMGSISGNVSDLNEIAEDIARMKACGAFECKVPGCTSNEYDYGWYILGSDWGCCANYPGCCYFANAICLVHDAICVCCDYKYFCGGPFCHPDPGCP
ncbi:uncharacterized protein LOC144453416 [Glandiceps talaboti]